MLEQTRSIVYKPPVANAVPLEHIYAAYGRTAGIVYHTPLVRLDPEACAQAGIESEIYLKLEMLQPVGSFKLRGAAAALTAFEPEVLRRGVWTASAGNMGFALAWCARRMSVPCAVVVPADAPPAKLKFIAAQNARIYTVPFAVYQQVQAEHTLTGEVNPGTRAAIDGMTLVHPFDDLQVMAGNGCIGLEILEDLPQVDAVLVPYGGGGLSCGIASTLRLLRPQARLIACEVETAAPLSASLIAGQPVDVPYTASFVSGIGAPFVFPRMWPLASKLIDSAHVVSLAEVRRAIRVLADRVHIIAEGAGAVPVAAALDGAGSPGRVVCVVSGGNLDRSLAAEILAEN